MPEVKAGRVRRFVIVYWTAVALLIGFGIVGMSVGIPFFILGVTLALLAPYRDRPEIFWPVLAGVVFFMVGFVLIAPLTCSSFVAQQVTVGPPAPASYERAGQTICASLIGLRYTGPGLYQPSFAPAFLTGLGSAGAATWGARLLVRRRKA